jgi:hypothetical protein
MIRLELHSLFDRDVVLTVVGLIAGGLIGWGLSQVYYRKSLRDQEASNAEQSRVMDLILRGIESTGTIKYVRDESGKVTGVAIQLRGSATDTTSATGYLTTSPGPSKK